MSRLGNLATRGNTPVLALSVATGVVVAALIAGFEYVAAEVLLHQLQQLPLWQV